MQAYRTTYTFIYGGVAQRRRTLTYLCDEAPPNGSFSGDDFDGLWDLTHRYAAMIPLEMRERKNGERFLRFYDELFHKITWRNIKPWELAVSNEEISVSFKQLMEFNSEDVIKYLKERGMTTCPILDK